MARPPEQSNLVDPLEGPEEAKRRLKLVLQTITGEKDIASVCAELGLSKSGLYNLRTKALMAALAGLEPGSPGRPAAAAEDPDLAQLRSQLRQKELELEIERLRTAVAIAERAAAAESPSPELKKNTSP